MVGNIQTIWYLSVILKTLFNIQASFSQFPVQYRKNRNCMQVSCFIKTVYN